MRSSGIAVRVLAFACIAGGLATFPTPIPSGIPLLSLGLALLLVHTRLGPVWLRAARRRSPLFDRLTMRLEGLAPVRLRTLLRRYGRRPAK